MNNRDAAGKIRARKPFSGSNFWGWDVTESRVATTLERADWRRCLGVAS